MLIKKNNQASYSYPKIVLSEMFSITVMINAMWITLMIEVDINDEVAPLMMKKMAWMIMRRRQKT